MARLYWFVLIILFQWMPAHVFCDEPPTVLIAILARNKGHFLAPYLRTIYNLDYPKKSITLYVNTNNNQDDTAEQLQQWIAQHRSEYREVIFENYNIDHNPETAPHDWGGGRLKILGAIRQKSLQVALSKGVDYYFVVDCDNFLAPRTLKALLEKKKEIIAPLLGSIPIPGDGYANFFLAVDANGYFLEDPFYYKLLLRQVRGTLTAPVVHCTYLIDARCIPKLSYVDDSDKYEFLIFSESARNNGVQQWICNEEEFGVQWHHTDNLTREQEKEGFSQFLRQHPEAYR